MAGTLVLDSEGLSKLLLRDEFVTTYLAAAQRKSLRVTTTVLTVLEAGSERVHAAHAAWTLSRLDVVEVTRPLMEAARTLLRTHRLRGHKYAIDAVLAASARAAAGPVTVLTSDPEDLAVLCGSGVRIVKV